MVHTHLQLKWPNHSTHLLTRLTYLFKNEQLVDCTLTCNKHSLKVHRSVLAACSPYFERELQNNPSIVVKDMQFGVLKALIEFMYYGETRITEENLTSLIEAAKIFEVKGLSEMDMVSGKNGIVSSVSTLDNDCIVESSCLSDDIDKATYEATTILQQSLSNSTAATSTSILDTNTTTCAITNNASIPHRINHCDGTLPLYEVPNGSDLISGSTNGGSGTSYDDHQDHSAPHSSRNFVVTPPQTESAQILLSLARSHNQKLFSSHIDDDGNLANEEIENNAFLNHDHVNDGQINGEGIIAFDHQQQQQQQQQQNEHEQQQQQQHSINNSNMIFTEHNLIINDTSNGSGLISMATVAAAAAVADSNNVENETGSVTGEKSLLAKLLTRNNHDMEQVANNYTKSTMYEVSQKTKNATTTLTAADLQSSIIYDCPFLIETTDGTYVDVSMENMLNSLNGAATQAITVQPAIPVGSPEIVDETSLYDTPLSSGTMINLADPTILERIKQETASELEDDPDAVVLTKISEDGRVEKYVLSSSDIEALKQLNERLAAAKAAANSSSRPSSADLAAEIEIPGDSTPLITKILVDGTGGIQNAINRLPFRKTIVGCDGAAVASPSEPEDSMHEVIMDGTLTVDDTHHHENMFEELDNQFNTMNCAIDDEEHIRRDYVAYEEASKNETQLEHNYYANALKMKDEDEEGVVISDQYDLRMMMMIEDPPTQQAQPDLQDDTAAEVKSSSIMKKRYQNIQLLGPATSSAADICLNGNTFVAFAPKSTPATLRLNGGLNNVSASVTSAALASCADKIITVAPPNGSDAVKCDLIVNDALINSVLNNPAVASSTAALVKPTTALAFKRKIVAAENNVLPFKCVKSANTFRNNAKSKKSSTTATKRTYNRRKPSNTSNQNQSKKAAASFNGAFSNENNLIEEIIVDEIS